MDHWDTVDISIASAEQRKGRAGRLGPGLCLRWWDQTSRREKFAPPEIAESDLAPLVLETALWGSVSPFDLKWLTPPPQAAVDSASELLRQLSLIDDRGRITEMGRDAAVLGLHPRLGHMVRLLTVKDGLLRPWLRPRSSRKVIFLEMTILISGIDFRPLLYGSMAIMDSVQEGLARRIMDESRRILRISAGGDNYLTANDIDPDLAGKLLALAYPDRTAQKTGMSDNSSRWVLKSGRAARLSGPLANE